MRYLFLLVFFLLISCTQENPYFVNARKNDVKKLPSVSGDWLLSHPEKYVSFDDFSAKYKPLATSDLQSICIQPIEGSVMKSNPDFQKCASYISLFFQKKVQINSHLVINANERNSRKSYDSGIQLNARFINDSILTKPEFKKNLATMALTTEDIFPSDDWSYVFGLANYKNRVGITSTYRFQSEEENLAFIRLIKTASHEIAHMFGLTHCVQNECVMNGCNHILELDRNSLRLCSLCQQKLAYRLNINPEKRNADLQKFFSENNLNEIASTLKKDQLD